MLTKADDYPIHQTPEPIAFAGGERNFYDRYFFNGYSADGEIFFAVALGVYPNLGIMDAAFAVRIGGAQYNLRASRHLGMERMDTQVGPIRVEVVEPLKRLRIVVAENAHGVAADIVFEARFAPVEEPRAIRRHGPRILSDFTRMTQFGRYEGWIAAGGRRERFEGRGVEGVRDRSWGVRAVGERDPQPMVPPVEAQFHWVWATLQFPDRAVLFYRNEDSAGAAWNVGMAVSHDDGRVEHLRDSRIALDFQPAARWPAHGRITAVGEAGKVAVELDAGPRFYMMGLGYMVPDWGHGMNKGPLAIGYDEIAPGQVEAYAPPYVYSQSLSRARLHEADGTTVEGRGSFELLSFGPNAALGLGPGHAAP